MFLYLASVSGACPYQVFNFTWVITNQAGDTANSSSTVSATTPWPILEVDLCSLALGASSDWGTPEHFLPQPKALELTDSAPTQVAVIVSVVPYSPYSTGALCLPWGTLRSLHFQKMLL